MIDDINKEAIIAKIQKILTLAERAGSDEEAQNATLQARRMLIKYNITMEEVNNFKDEECDEVTIILKQRSIPTFTHFLAAAAAKLILAATTAPATRSIDISFIALVLLNACVTVTIILFVIVINLFIIIS